MMSEHPYAWCRTTMCSRRSLTFQPSELMLSMRRQQNIFQPRCGIVLRVVYRELR
jgi:hypothetical protein